MFCHNQESDIFPEVPNQADYVLNKINIIKGYRNYVDTYAQDRKLVAELNRSYEELTAKWHRFDLDDVEADTKELLGAYRKAKGQALKDRKEMEKAAKELDFMLAAKLRDEIKTLQEQGE